MDEHRRIRRLQDQNSTEKLPFPGQFQRSSCRNVYVMRPVAPKQGRSPKNTTQDGANSTCPEAFRAEHLRAGRVAVQSRLAASAAGSFSFTKHGRRAKGQTMMQRTMWRTKLDGRTHRATVTGNNQNGYEIISDCGLTSHTTWGEKIDFPLEVTCPICRSKSEGNVQARAA